MSLIGKFVIYGRDNKKGKILDKYTKCSAWNTGMGQAFGSFDKYIIEDNGQLHHVDCDEIKEVLILPKNPLKNR